MNDILGYKEVAANSMLHRKTLTKLKAALQHYRLSPMQWVVLQHIYDSQDEGLTITTLAHILGTSLPYATNTVSQLVDKELVTRSHAAHGDQRLKIVRINPDKIDWIQKIEKELSE